MRRTLVVQDAPRAMHAFLVHAKVAAARLADDAIVQPPRSLAGFEVDVAAATTRARHHGQDSTGGERRLSARETGRADAGFEGLVPGTLYWFRHRAAIRGVWADWSDPLTFRPG